MAGSSIATRAQSMGRFWRSNWVLLRECTLLVLPMVTFSAILLGFIIHYQWHRRNLPVNGLSLDAEFGNSLFYIDYSATRIILIASCSSSTVFALMGSFMTLLSYPLAADMIRNSRVPYLGMLPTPDQLALLIDLLDGKKGALWRWLAGLWKTKGVKTHNVWAVDISAVILVFAIMLRSASMKSTPVLIGLCTNTGTK